jgi:DNA-binding Xre family transcriptional regulator
MEIEVDHKKIKDIAFGKGLFPSELINKTKISSAQVYRILNGQQERVFERTAFSLAKAMKCDIDDFSK